MGFKELTKRIFPTDIEDDNFEERGYEDDFEEESSSRSTDNVFPARGGTNVVMAPGSSIEMKVVTPKSYDTVTQIADLLLEKKTVLLNLENTNRETARRLIDFLSGSAYALGGGVQKVAENTYAITPSNVAVSNDNQGAIAPSSDVEGGVIF